MTRTITRDPQRDGTGNRLGAAMDAIPTTAEQAHDGARMERWAQNLLHIVYDPDESLWQRAFPRKKVDLWLEDALLLDVLPRVAALLGEGWADDEISFVDVSIGSARIQEALRHLGIRATRAATTPVIPVIVPPWEQHVLAAQFAAHRICRAGQRAVMLTGLSAERAGRMPIIQTAPALLISATDRPARGRLENYLLDLRTSLKAAAPIIAGGPAFTRPYIDKVGSNRTVCFDNDPITALRSCGIKLSSPDRGPELSDPPGSNGVRH